MTLDIDAPLNQNIQYTSILKYCYIIISSSSESSETWGTNAAVLLKGRSSTANSGTKCCIFLGMNRCVTFPLLTALHSLFSIWTDLKWSEKISGAPTWRCGEWIWLTGPSGFHRNSPQRLNIITIIIIIIIGVLPNGRSFTAITGD